MSDRECPPERRNDLIEFNAVLEELRLREKYNYRTSLFPETGPFSRDKYPRILEHFKAGAKYDKRLLMAGNQLGKTLSAAYEVSCHADGVYPDWWEGYRFTGPVRILCVGVTATSTKDVLQGYLIGENIRDPGTGMIPKRNLADRMVSAAGVTEGLEKIRVRHNDKDGIFDGMSSITFRYHKQGREPFQGAKYDLIWFDEEPPADIYSEAIRGTTATNGRILMTYTPLKGMSEVIMKYLHEAQPHHGEHPEDPHKYTTIMNWFEVPHITDEKRQSLLADWHPDEVEARSMGLPFLGGGLIFPLKRDQITCDPFPIPDHYERAYGFDTSPNRTAVVWGARDPDTDMIYIYDEYFRGRAEASIHAHAIKSRGEWIAGAIDPSSQGASGITDLRKTVEVYLDLGLDLELADNSVESSISIIWQALSSGKLKIFSHLTNLLKQLALYRRNDHGVIDKKNNPNDDGVDALRYYVMTGQLNGKSKDEFMYYEEIDGKRTPEIRRRDLGANDITGY